MKQWLALALVLGLLGATALVAAPADKEQIKEALRELQDFIGGWKGTGQTKPRPSPRDPFWEETVEWSWRFKGDDIWLAVEFKGGKFLKSAEVRYLTDKKKYELTGTPVTGKDKLVFLGTVDKGKATFERTDPKTREVQRIRMLTTAEGIRFSYFVERRSATGTIWRPEFQLAGNKIGESFAKAEKRPECVVSGGLGTMVVTYNGETFYVCCSGCAEAFRENPKKYVDEYKKSRKK